MTEPTDYKDPFEYPEELKKSHKDHPVSVPSEAATMSEIEELIESYGAEVRKNMDDADAIEAIKKYSAKLIQVYLGHFLNGEYDRCLNKEEATLAQSVETPNGPLRINGQRPVKGKQLTGNAAVIALQGMLGVGRPTKIPLWHSGLVLTVGNFRESEILTLNQVLNEQRMEVGYSTSGFLFSGSDVNLVMTIVDFVLDHVTTANIKGWIPGDTDTLKELILVPDIQPLLAGALESIYPSGYPAIHSCKNAGTEKCHYSPKLKREEDGREFDADSLLRFGRTVWVDTNRVSVEAKRHMSAPNHTYTKEEIKAYQNSFNQVSEIGKRIQLEGAELQFTYQIPTVESYARNGALWTAGVVDMVDRAMNTVNDADSKTRAKKRRQFIKNYEQVLRFQKFSCWIKNIQYHFGEEDEEPTIISDRKTIAAIMEELAQDETTVKQAIDDLHRYQEEIQVVFCGIPNFKCPDCGESQAEGAHAKRGLIPMSMVTYFFIIMVLRLGRIA